MKIGLHYTLPKNINGVYKVIINTIKGLEELGHEVYHNKIMEINGVLQGMSILDDPRLPLNTLVGPAVYVLPPEKSLWLQKYKNWAQPSQWVVDYQKTFKETINVNLNIWAAGIDTEQFNYNKRDNFKYDCFIYYKNVTKQCDYETFEKIKQELDKRHKKYIVFEYGKYNEINYIDLLKQCRYGIFYTGTESQGIAYMEALSMNIPLYIYDCTTFKYGSFEFSNENVSSAPYFDNRCGMKHHNMSRFDEFIENLHNYSPREYILENHTLKKGAEKYIKILESIHE